MKYPWIKSRKMKFSDCLLQPANLSVVVISISTLILAVFIFIKDSYYKCSLRIQKDGRQGNQEINEEDVTLFLEKTSPETLNQASQTCTPLHEASVVSYQYTGDQGPLIKIVK